MRCLPGSARKGSSDERPCAACFTQPERAESGWRRLEVAAQEGTVKDGTHSLSDRSLTLRSSREETALVVCGRHRQPSTPFNAKDLGKISKILG